MVKDCLWAMGLLTGKEEEGTSSGEAGVYLDEDITYVIYERYNIIYRLYII